MKTFPFNLIDELVCPCCGSRFEVAAEVQSTRDGLTDGILRCDCYEYPVVSGIAVLRQMSQVASTQNGAVDFLKQRNSKGALLWLLENGGATGVPGLADGSFQTNGMIPLVRRFMNSLRKKHLPLKDIPISLQHGFEAALQSTKPRGYADYLFYRFANQSILGAIPLLILLADYCHEKFPRRVLDLLCGVGHTSAILNILRPEIDIVCADFDFVNLFLAQNYLAQKMSAICLDAELPLPFTNSSFGGLFCLDGLHYVRSKVALLREVDRIISTVGLWVFAHMHNSTAVNENPGTPLSAEGYAKRFSFGYQRIIPETEVLRQFQSDGSLDLTFAIEPHYLTSTHAISLVGTRAKSLWKKHHNLDDALFRKPGRIGFNPIYQLENVPEGMLLRAAWPSDSFRQECIRHHPALPDSVRIPRNVVDAITLLQTTHVSPSSDLINLMRSGVILSLPNCYDRPGTSHA